MKGRYASAKTLGIEYEISATTVSKYRKLIESHPERYAEDAVIDVGGKIRIRRDCFHDAFMNRYLIERGLAGHPDPMLTKIVWGGGI